MQQQGKQLLQISAKAALGFMLMKLVVTPLVMLGLAVAFDFDDVAGRAAVLIASLPLSMAAFSLG